MSLKVKVCYGNIIVLTPQGEEFIMKTNLDELSDNLSRFNLLTDKMQKTADLSDKLEMINLINQIAEQINNFELKIEV